MISLMIDTAMGGSPENLQPYHRTSLTLHVINACLTTVLLFTLFRSAWTASAVGLLFGLHPLTVEPIPWVGERKTLLAATFFFLSLSLYVKWTTQRSPSTIPATRNRGAESLLYAGSLIAFMAALMSKPTSTALPIVLLLLDIWPLKRFNRRAIIEKLPFFAIATASAVITYVSQRDSLQVIVPGDQSPIRMGLVICHNIIFYPLKMLWPTNLAPHYPFPEPMSLTTPAYLFGVVGTFALMGLLAYSLKRTAAWLTGWTIFFVAIFPTLGVIGFTNVIASDKYAYLPAIGFMLPIAWWLSRLAGAKAGPSNASIGVVICLLLMCESWQTRKQYAIWRDRLTLYGRMAELAPRSGIIRDGYGTVLADSGNLAAAAAEYKEALRLRPDYANAHSNYGTVLRELGQLDQAIVHYQEAIRLDPRYTSPRINLANMFRRRGDLDEAIRQYRAALEIEPRKFQARLFLRTAFLEQKNYDAAAIELEQAAQLDPSQADARLFLGMAHESAGRIAEAKAAYRETLRLRPDDPRALERLSRLN
jgi:Tfp pilus assembly protein PilF